MCRHIEKNGKCPSWLSNYLSWVFRVVENLGVRFIRLFGGFSRFRIMAMKLFVLGLPGSGKSTAARCITGNAGKEGKPSWISDYIILKNVLDDTEYKQFKSIAYDGFDVFGLSVFDTALRKLEQDVLRYSSLQHK